MTEIVDKITICSTPDKIWDRLVFFFQGTENYKSWHKDHVSCYWKKGKDFLPGSILVAEENIHGAKHKLGFKIIDSKRDSFLNYRMLFPFSILCYGGCFKMIPMIYGTEFIAQLDFRAGGLLKVVFKKKMDALRIHMKEEGQNIKGMVEK